MGTSEFTAAGQARVVRQGAHAILEINTFGTGSAEAEVLLRNVTDPTLGADDFNL